MLTVSLPDRVVIRKMSQPRLSRVSSASSFRQRHYSERSGRSVTAASQASIETEDEEETVEEIDDLFQRNLSWKTVLYLPFDSVWENIIIGVMILDLVVMTLIAPEYFASNDETNKNLNSFDLMADLLMLLDNFLMIGAKVVHGLKISYEHVKRPIWLILLNFISSIPDGLVDLVLGKGNESIDHYLMLGDFLKVIHVLYYLYYRLQMIRYQRVALAAYNYVITIFCVYLIINYVFFLQRCIAKNYKCNYLDRYFILINAVSTIVYKNVGEISTDFQLLYIQCIFSYITYFCVFVPVIVEMIIAFINKNQHKYAFQYKRQVTEKILTDSNTLGSVRKRIVEFFELHWDKNNGFDDTNLKPFLETCAPSLVEELVLDMNCRALKHSKLFQNMDLPFLRCVTMAMEQTFALPGELLYQKDSNKHKMIYVVSGIIQVLSEQDGDTTIMSLSAGTCLGETTLIFNYNSTCAILCKEYCEFQILSMDKLVHVGKKFPKQVQRLRRMVINRYGMARRLKSLGNLLNRSKEEEINANRIRIMWLNNTLHRLMMKDEETFLKHNCQNIYLREDFDSSAYETMTSTATFLDLLAITERTELVSDSVFHYTDSFLPILQPNSVLLNAWDILVCVLTLIVCFTTPIYTFMVPYAPAWYWWVIHFSTFVYMVDIYLTITTAVIKQNLVITVFQEIFFYHIGSWKFWCDLFAAYPLQFHSLIFLHSISDMSYSCLCLNRCLKFFKIIKVYQRYTKRYRRFAILIEYLQFILITSYLTFFFTTVLHAAICRLSTSAEKCYEEQPLSTAFWSNFSSVGFFLYLYGIVYSGPFKYIYILVDVYVLLSVIAASISLVFLAHIISKQIMSSHMQIQLVKVTTNFKEIAKYMGVGKTCTRRISDYITTQWNYNSGQKLFSSSDILADMPSCTYKLFKENYFQNFVKNMPVFKELSDEIIIELCALAQIDILPPKEVICYKGESANFIFYLIEGFVELVSGPESVHTIGPGESISVFEAYLNLPILNTSITLTHCQLLTIPWKEFQGIHSTKVQRDISPDECVEVDYDDLKQQFIQIIGKDKSDVSYDLDDNTKIESIKSFGYNLKVDSDEEYEYYVPFDRLRQFSFVRYLLLRVTFLPYGKFVFLWELLRSTVAVISAFLFTVPPIITCRDCYWFWILIFLDLMALLDIYFKLHYCYYNDKGLLVTHPLKTASHYLKHSFLIDVITILPIRFLFNTDSGHKNKVNSILHFIKCLQLYRAYCFFTGISLVREIGVNLLRYFFNVLTVTLLLSSLLVNIMCEFHPDIPDTNLFVGGVRCFNDSSFGKHMLVNYNISLNPLTVYIFSIIIVSLYLVNINGMLHTQAPIALYKLIHHFFLIGGYCLYVFLLAKFFVLRTKQMDILEYKRELYLLKKFMKQQKVGLVIQREIIQYYELQWEKNRNNGLYRITENLNATLKADIIYDIYGNVLERTLCFHDVERQFLKSLLMVCKHEAFKNDFTICNVNDIMPLIYILYAGSVQVIAPDGSILTALGPGAMFGNLEEYPRVRQTVGFVTSGNVEVLAVSTLDYFQNLKKYPRLYKNFKYLTAIHIDYLEGRSGGDVIKDDYAGDSKRCSIGFNTNKINYKIWKFIQLVFICYIFNTIHMYMFTVNEHNHYIYGLLYISDLLYFIDVVFVRTRTISTDETGRLASLISRLSLIPLDVPVWLIPMSRDWRYKLISYLRFNRQLRMYDLYVYFKLNKDKLNSNQILLRCTALVCFVFSILQLCSYLYVTFRCLTIANKSPVFGRYFKCELLSDIESDGEYGNSSDKLFEYVIALYIIAELLVVVSQLYTVCFDLYVLMYISILSIATSIFSAFLFAEVCSILRSHLHWRSVYEASCCHLLNFMKRRDLSEQMIKKVWNYVRYLWKRQNGVTFPKMLVEAPDPLKLKVMSYCYLNHIKKNAIFGKCHEDFLRQLVLILRMYTYFPGDYIVFKGDINGCMYFIHKGSVLMMSDDTCRKEDIIGKLIVGQSFGVMQGIYPATAHVHYYQAASKCDVLCLKSDAWMYLLDYFPASREIIYSAAENYLGF